AAANRRTLAAPMPLLPPVTIATLPASGNSSCAVTGASSIFGRPLQYCQRDEIRRAADDNQCRIKGRSHRTLSRPGCERLGPCDRGIKFLDRAAASLDPDG